MSIYKLHHCAYHYTNSEVALTHILDSFTLKMGLFNLVNDPKEAKVWPFKVYTKSASINAKFDREIFEMASRYITHKTLMLCCTVEDEGLREEHIDSDLQRGFGHPRMWAQYANNHKGVCIVLDKEKLHQKIKSLSNDTKMYFGRVKYLGTERSKIDPYGLIYYEDILESGLENFMNDHIEKHSQELFFTKHIDWMGESEYRWVMRAEKEEPIFIPIKDCILGVILGNDCNEVEVDQFKTVCQKNQIPLYIMYWKGWNASVFGGLENESFDSKVELSLNGISFRTDVPCGGVFTQACNQFGKIQTILIDTDGNVQLFNPSQ